MITFPGDQRGRWPVPQWLCSLGEELQPGKRQFNYQARPPGLIWGILTTQVFLFNSPSFYPNPTPWGKCAAGHRAAGHCWWPWYHTERQRPNTGIELFSEMKVKYIGVNGHGGWNLL
jgi:hypothetical protein